MSAHEISRDFVYNFVFGSFAAFGEGPGAVEGADARVIAGACQ
jgi:hypothetical protein